MEHKKAPTADTVGFNSNTFSINPSVSNQAGNVQKEPTSRKRRIKETFINELRETADILAIAEQYTDMKRSGRNYFGICPYPDHSEKTGSFSVNTDTNRFRCYGCSRSGDVFQLVMEIDGLSFPDSVEKVAQLTGIAVEYEEVSPEQEAKYAKSERIQRIKEKALEYFHQQLLYSERGKQAYEYLTQRGFSDDTIKKYSLGYAPNNYKKELIDFTGATEQELYEAKLLSFNQEKGSYPLFYFDRIMFPFFKGKVIAGFQGRAVGDGNPKYLLPSELQLPIWNLIALKKYSEVMVFEGIPDALTAIELGFENVIAITGVQKITALGHEKVNELFKKVEKAYLILDADEQGSKANRQLAMMLGKKAYIVQCGFPTDTVTDEEGKQKRLVKDLNGYYTHIGQDKDKAVAELTEWLDESKPLLETEFDVLVSMQDEMERALALPNWLELLYQVHGTEPLIIDVWLDRLVKAKLVKKNRLSQLTKQFEKSPKTNWTQTGIQNPSSESFDIPDSAKGLDIPRGWLMSKSGLRKEGVDREGNPYIIPVTDSPFYITALFEEKETGNYKVELTYLRGNEWKTEIVDRADIASKAKIEKLAGKGFPVTSVNARNVVQFLSEFESTNWHKLPIKRATTLIGWTDGKFVTPVGTLSRDGFSTDDDLIFHRLVEPAITLEFKECADWEGLVREILPNLIALNQKQVTLPTVGWFLVSPLAKPLRETRPETPFPILNLYGTFQSGKTTTATMCWRMLGVTDQTKKIGKAFTLAKYLSYSNAIPILLDEYTPEKLTDNFIDTLKLVYTSGEDSRGRADQSIVKYPYVTPTCILGEPPLEEDGILSRTLMVNHSKEWFTANREKTKPHYLKLTQLPLTEFALGYYRWVGYEYYNSEQFHQDWWRAEEVAEQISQDERTVWNARVLYLGITILERLIEKVGLSALFTEEDKIKAVKYASRHQLEERKTALDHAMNFFAYSVLHHFPNDAIKYEPEEGLVWIGKQQFLQKIEEGRLRFKSPVIPPRQKLVTYLEEAYVRYKNSGDSYIRGLGKADETPKKIGKRAMRCLCIDVKKLEEIAEVDESVWQAFSNEAKTKPELPANAVPFPGGKDFSLIPAINK